MKLLDRLTYLEKAATKGPWKVFENDIGNSQTELLILAKTTKSWPQGYPVVEGPTDPEDCELIAESRNALPALLAVARKADKALGWVSKDSHSGCGDYCALCHLSEALAALEKKCPEK